jgi:hypothetical protein
MRLDFMGQNELSVKDRIPDGGDVPYPLLFAFLFAGNVLSEFPGDRQALIEQAVQRLSDRVDTTQPLARNESLLGVFSQEPPELLEPSDGGAHWVCEGTLMEKRGEVQVDARIAAGFGDSFHRASMDVAFERARQRLGESGGAVCVGMLQYLREISGEDCSDPESNCAKAREAALRAAQVAGLAS